MRLIFIPFSIAGSLVAGSIGKRIFTYVWGRVDEEEAPQPRHRDVSWSKVLIAAALQGAIFRLMRIAFDRGSRTAFYRLLGSWPGEKKTDPK